MARKCKHHGTVSQYNEDLTNYVWSRCIDCCDYVSLGRSNDKAPEVELEITLAEALAANAVTRAADGDTVNDMVNEWLVDYAATIVLRDGTVVVED